MEQIPEVVAKHIECFSDSCFSVYESMVSAMEDDGGEVRDFIEEHEEVYLRACLDGYEVV